MLLLLTYGRQANCDHNKPNRKMKMGSPAFCVKFRERDGPKKLTDLRLAERVKSYVYKF